MRAVQRADGISIISGGQRASIEDAGEGEVMEFKDGVPIGNRLDILQSMIRQRERAIQLIMHKSADSLRDILQLDKEVDELRAQFNATLAERAEE
jgi:hypothetical protein